MREGASIGAYRVLRRLGEGGMGAVFLAEHSLIGRHAAIKVLLPELSSKRASVDRFFNEARAITAVSDPGIVQVFDFGFTEDKTAYIVMEFLDGEPLSARLERLGPLTPADALRITRQVAGSLFAAHAAGIVHRDLKPENLFLVRDAGAPGGERAKILDFGVAKLDDEVFDRRRTRSGVVLGTPTYMSPEQCSGAAAVDHRADIYSLGCVLFHLLTGQPPFDLPGLGALIWAHMREPAPQPSSLALISADLDEIVMRCLAKSPDDRFATMLDVQQACDAILARLAPAGAPSVVTPSAGLPSARPTPSDAEILPASARRAAPSSPGIPATPPPHVVPRRRLGGWLMIGALATACGAAIALYAGRSSAREVREPSRLRAEAVPDPVPPAAPADAGVSSVAVSATPSQPPSPPIDAGAAAVTVDAGAASARPAQPSVGRDSAPAKRPAAVRPGGPARPTTPRTEDLDDLYNDRN